MKGGSPRRGRHGLQRVDLLQENYDIVYVEHKSGMDSVQSCTPSWNA